MITVTNIQLKTVKMELAEAFVSSAGTVTHRNILLCELTDQDGRTATSECVAQSLPNYSPETPDTCRHIITEHISPLIIGQTIQHPDDVLPILNEQIRGNYMAKATVEMGIWELAAQKLNTSLRSILGGTQDKIPSGIAIGLQESPKILCQKVKQAIASKYHKIKIKIKPGKDTSYLRAVRDACGYDFMLMADANSAYTLEDIDVIQSWDEFELKMIEQPLAWDDIFDHAALQAKIQTPICLDESIIHLKSAQLAVEQGAAQVINIKPGRVGGLSEAKRIHDYCHKHNIPVWCGGMLETSIGRAYNVALASLPGFTIPGDMSPSNRYWTADIGKNSWILDDNGYLELS